MLTAKELKKVNIINQRVFIEAALFNISTRANGDPTYLYEGYLYPELKTYFENNGYKICPTKVNNGLPASIFLPNEENCELTAEDWVELDSYLKESCTIR